MSNQKKKRIEKLKKIKDEDIDYSDIPELGENFWRNAELISSGKKSITIRLDQDILEWFQKQGRGYQTRMNAILRTYVSAQKV